MAKKTEREKHVLELASEGLSCKEISMQLGVSKQTVKNRLGMVYLKQRRRLLMLNEVAGMLRVHPNTVRQWEKEGKLKAYRIGSRRDRRFDPEEVREFLKGG